MSEANVAFMLSLIVFALLFILIWGLLRFAEHLQKQPTNMLRLAVLAARYPLKILLVTLLVQVLMLVTDYLLIEQQVLKAWYFELTVLSLWLSGVLYLHALIRLLAEIFSLRAKAQDDAPALTYVNGMKHLGHLLLYTLALVTLLDHYQVSLTGLLAIGGAGGIAAGLAAKDMLSNLFGGLVIFLDRPFYVGDLIRSQDGKIEGTVQEIGWRTTQVTDLDRIPLHVPNALFTTMVIANLSRRESRRFREMFSIRYGDVHCLPTIVRRLRESLKQCCYVLKGDMLLVDLYAFNDSSVDILLQCYLSSKLLKDYVPARAEILQMVHTIVTEEGAQMPFPTLTIEQLKQDEEAEAHQ